MNEQIHPHKFLQMQKDRLAEVRRKTIPPSESGGYGVIESTLEEYEQKLLNGQKLINIANEIHRLHPNEPVRILDFGCGQNVALRELVKDNHSDVPLEVSGISVGDPRDPQQKEIDEANHIQFTDLQKVTQTFDSEAYDIIISKLAFNHLSNPLQTLKKLYNALKIGGTMYIEWEMIGGILAGLDTKLKTQEESKSLSIEERESLVKKVRDDLKLSGINIEGEGRIIIIKKTEAEMKFHNISLSPTLSGKDMRWDVYRSNNI